MKETQAGRRYWAAYIKRTLLELLVVAVGGILLDRWMTSDYSVPIPPLESALIAIAVYLAASFGLALVHFLSGILYLWWFGGKDMEQEVLADLRNAGVPGPEDWQGKRFDYLELLANDEEALPADRVKAAALYSGYQVAYRRAGFFAGIALAQAWDNAALRYSEEAPRRPDRDY